MKPSKGAGSAIAARKPRQIGVANKSEDTIEYGFKRISPANLVQPDHMTPYSSRLRGDKWLQACLKPRLEPCVPKEVAFLFEVARGSMIYGLFFCPLASLASEQCYRVLEAGARRRCDDLGLSGRKQGKSAVVPGSSFSKIIAVLKQAGRITKADYDAWSTMPFLRNRVSHPTRQSISSRDSAVGVLANTAGLLNGLFR